MTKIEAYKKILIINLGGIGDLLLSTPALRALKGASAQTELSLLVVPRVRELAAGLPYVAQVETFRKELSPAGYLEDLFTLLKLRKRRFDLAINMRTLVSPKSAAKIKFLLDIIKPRQTMGRDTEGWGAFFDIRIPETLQGRQPEMEYDISAVNAIGVNVTDKNITLDAPLESTEMLNKILASRGITGDTKIIGIHPGGIISRRWPAGYFADAITRIGKKIPCSFIITGLSNEAKLAKEIIRLTDAKIIDLTGKLNLAELAALIKRCQLFITNDTGPMHLAAALKTPLVAIMGPGDIQRYDPRAIFSQAIVLHKDTGCSPCDKQECASLECLKKISPDEVAEAAVRLYRQ